MLSSTFQVLCAAIRYVESRSVRLPGGGCPRPRLHITGLLQPLQPADHVPVFVEDLAHPVVRINWRRASCECLSLHFQIDLDVCVCCSELNMAQPSLNDG